ncbi:Fc.00g102940.m01.CDS01 [Cosmosporella sp. VM-42]
MDGPDISQIAKDCQISISVFSDATKQNQSVREYVSERDVIQTRERFDQWAGNLGALQPSRSRLSLEHRLCKTPLVRNAIMAKLEDFHESVQAATSIATGSRVNRVTPAITVTEIDLEEYDISSSDSDSAVSSTSSFGIVRQTEEMKVEIQELMSAIKLAMDNLFRFSIFVRKFAPKDKRERASNTKLFDDRADVMYIRDRYPVMTTKNKALATRLGEANARRRQYFKYRRDHNNRLSRPREHEDTPQPEFHLQPKPTIPNQECKTMPSVLSDTTMPTLLADTEVTALMDDSFDDEDKFAAILDAEPAMSAVSFATSVVESSEDSLAFPALPAEARINVSFICPYCWKVISLKPNDQDHQWRCRSDF